MLVQLFFYSPNVTFSPIFAFSKGNFEYGFKTIQKEVGSGFVLKKTNKYTSAACSFKLKVARPSERFIARGNCVEPISYPTEFTETPGGKNIQRVRESEGRSWRCYLADEAEIWSLYFRVNWSGIVEARRQNSGFNMVTG